MPNQILTFSELYNAYKLCRKNKRNTFNALKFEINVIDNIYELLYKINGRYYKPKRYICFYANSPKTREIFASDFSDRIIHHLLIKDLEQVFEPIFIYDSYSCRENKGIHLAITRLKKWVKNRKNSWYAQLDIRNFFYSIDKNILFDIIKEKTNLKMGGGRNNMLKERILYLSKILIYDDPTKNYILKGEKNINLNPLKSLFSTPKHRGLPIGNLTSQFFANCYMNILDQYIKRVLKTKHYMRYVDDFILLGSTKEELIDKKEKIVLFLKEKLSLKIRDDFKIKNTKTGIDFLGYIVKPTHTLVRRRVVNNFKYKKAKLLEEEGNINTIKYKELVSSYKAHFKHADSFKLTNKMLKTKDI